MKKQLFFVINALALVFCMASAWGKGIEPSTGAFSQTTVALSFLENKGQVTDQFNKPRTDIQYSVRATAGLNIFIGNGAIHYQFSKLDNATVNDMQRAGVRNNDKTILPEVNMTLYRMDVELIGANKDAHAIAEEQQEYYENYFTTATVSKGGVAAHTYNRITYKNIYPHIDWVLYMQNGVMKHEFVVNAGGMVSDIHLKYGGATALVINADGSLTATTPLGTITEQAPVSYQADGKQVKSNFLLNGDILSYAIDSYTGVLVIDPALRWGTYLGGDGREVAYGVAKDRSGSVYFAGYTLFTSYSLATAGAYQVAYAGGVSYGDALLVKFSNAGARLWATYYGGANDDAALGIATDASDNIFIAGFTKSITGIATPGAYQVVKGDTGARQDAFLAKFNSAGAMQWATYYGDTGTDNATGVATDVAGNVFITGSTSSTDNVATAGAYQSTQADTGNKTDAYIAKFNNAGFLQWATYYGGAGTETSKGIATDQAGNIFVTGETRSASGIATAGTHLAVRPDVTGQADIYLAKFSNALGMLQWGSYYGGGTEDAAAGITTDLSGNVYITGYTNSASGIASAGAHQTVFIGAFYYYYDAYLAKFGGTGNLLWGTYYGGSVADFGAAVATDSAGNVYLAGHTLSTNRVATTDGYQTVSFGPSYNDVFFAIFTAAGVRQYGTYYGGNRTDECYAITTGGGGDIFIAGTTFSPTNIVTPGAYQITRGDFDIFGDAFLSKFNIQGLVDVNDVNYEDNMVKIYPNPAHNAITITSAEAIDNVRISNLLGQTVYASAPQNTSLVVSLVDLPAGIYLVRVNDDKMYKVVKE